MPRVVIPLTDARIKNAKPKDKPYKVADGGGLYLEVTPAGSKLWRMKFIQESGKESRLSFGAYPAVSLAQARAARSEARQLKAVDIDPGKASRDTKVAKASANANTFAVVAGSWLAKTSAMRAASTQAKVEGWLKHDILPHLGRMPIAGIEPRDVLVAIQKIEARGAIDTAHRVKQICGQIFRHAVAIGSASRDVTADLRGALAVVPKSNYAAITEPGAVGALLRSIYAYTGHQYAVTALKLSPMVFVRPGELRSAEWAEIDLEAAEWRISAAKMKMKIAHIVPLSTQAVGLLRAIHELTGAGKYVFPSIRTNDRCMSENTINAALRSMGYPKDVMTGHGFRAMARTIMDEVLGERVDLIEHQMAHAVRDVHGRAYNRTAHLPARREMMQRWSDYLDQLRAGATK